MTLIDLLIKEAVKSGLLEDGRVIDPETAFRLVRDMPYIRASSREPETIIREWRGTCSGKHYLLRELFKELGYSSRVMACTTRHQIDPVAVPPELASVLARQNGRFVDVHNYLILELPDGDMIVDATWPLSVKDTGLAVNEHFALGRNQQIACDPIQTWVVPEDEDPQVFKNKLLITHFSAEELEIRDKVILTMGGLFMAAKNDD